MSPGVSRVLLHNNPTFQGMQQEDYNNTKYFV